MTLVAASNQGGDKLGCAFGQDDFPLNHDGVATEMHRLFRDDIDQIGNVFANGVLPVFVECSGTPKGRAVWQRTKTSVEMIKAWIDKFD